MPKKHIDDILFYLFTYFKRSKPRLSLFHVLFLILSIHVCIKCQYRENLPGAPPHSRDTVPLAPGTCRHI
jgi:hypothetical protein